MNSQDSGAHKRSPNRTAVLHRLDVPPGPHNEPKIAHGEQPCGPRTPLSQHTPPEKEEEKDLEILKSETDLKARFQHENDEKGLLVGKRTRCWKRDSVVGMKLARERDTTDDRRDMQWLG